MATYFGIDKDLLALAHKVGGQRTKKATINEALRQYVEYRKRLGSQELIGSIEVDPRSRSRRHDK